MDTGSTEETRYRRQAGDALRRWAEQGRPAGVVRVLERQGFGTVATSQLLAGTEDGDRAGELSVVGEVLAARRGRSGGPLTTAAGRIGG
ncbi:MAG: hypothetical protein H0V41_14120 [Pseudonocardiales bacterium]|nr:hypothetical protein [Pseudonocardiales bacterium]